MIPVGVFLGMVAWGTTAASKPMPSPGFFLPEGDWNTGWSGPQAEVETDSPGRTPEGDPALRFRWRRGEDGTLPRLSRSFPVRRLEGDVIAFWLRLDRPLEFLQVILLDADEVGAEQSIPALLGMATLKPGRWHYVVWPFRTNPGWVRYRRGQVDWDRIQGLSLYTRPDQLHPEVTVEVGPFRVLSYRQLEEIFQRHPDRAGSNRALPWRVLAGKRTDRMMADYHRQRAQEQVAALHARYPPTRFVLVQEEIRRALAEIYLMPPSGGKPEASLQRLTEVDGIRVEHQLLALREGVYSPALVFRPPLSSARPAPNRHPAILMLPGHGDPNWSPALQSRCLSFAHRGYIVMLVQPFGQAERGENPRWNESHDSQAMAYLLTTGQSLLGLIMADHQAELTYLLSRRDVDPERVGVTGVSMGGTHSLWFSALDPRVRATVAVAAAALTRPVLSFRHHGLCDLMVGLYQVADEDLILALSAPRALMRLYPSSEAPLTDEGLRQFLEGWVGYEEALQRFRMTPEQLAEYYRYPREVYAQWKVPQNYTHRVVEGPHDYNQAMREVAAGWFAHHLRGAESSEPLPEAPLSPLTDRSEAIAALSLWPRGERPPDFLTPTAYVQRETAARIAQLPGPPDRLEDWLDFRRRLQQAVRRLLGVSLSSPHAGVEKVGTFRAEEGSGHKLVVRPEPGLELPLLLFAPADGVPSDGRLVVLLHPGGLRIPAGSRERRARTRAGAWVLCVDLRGMGETRYDQESGGYLGFRDLDMAMAALKLGDTLAGYWVKDLLAAIEAVEPITQPRRVIVRGERETGLVALLAAGQSDLIQAVETTGLLASYYSPRGYGRPFAYSDENNDQSVRSRPLGGYGSMVPCIPRILRFADIPQLAALVAPRPLAILAPREASGEPVPEPEIERAWAWTRQVYRLYQAAESLQLGG